MPASGEKGWSLRWMIAALMLAIVGIGWAVAANDYTVNAVGPPSDGEIPSARYRVARHSMFQYAMLQNAFQQIPNAPQVISHAFAGARWIVYVFGGLEFAAVLFGIVLWRVERESAEGMGDARRKR